MMFARFQFVKALALSLAVSLPSVCWAQGSINPVDRFAWASSAGWLNFAPTHGDGVTVVCDGDDGYLMGCLWGENIGWIKMGSGQGNGPYVNSSVDDWGVNMDASGNLSGFGWSSHTGWINFSPAHGGVSIDLASGDFDGAAWGENIGWIRFRCNDPAYGVQAVFPLVRPPADVDAPWMLYD